MIAVSVVPYVWLRYLYYTEDVHALSHFESQFGLCPRNAAKVWQAFPEVDFLVLWTEGLTPFATYMFLHAGPVHLLANMSCLFVLGSRLETWSSGFRFLLVYLSCGIVAGIAQYLWPQDSGAVMLGSSGAVVGVIAIYLVCAWRARILLLLAPLPLFVEVPVWVLVLAWVLLQLPPVQEFLKMGGGQPVDPVAYLGGLAAGLLLGWPLCRRGKQDLAA